MANFEFARQYGNSFDINNFISLANANPAAQSISRDLLVGASAIFIWIVNESKKLNIKFFFFLRDWDRNAFPHATKGFFKFKKNIPDLIDLAHI